ncbi:hypothetical protein BN59_01925 [Legionella massiliensis]|uniref:Smr domain protein n=1 Tax=Legionella massiliensis TaxID=1034943 RepID=A0A078KXD2_9GAMM|nr:hypothetical protein [Legionella massiliensis]CDZ77641.1 hypothetical protein BN59_01925 [Legionella massiliensis]CEE13379.1 hypothetical protein BN1094_01925 [Legionella massiliensis]
MSKKRGIIEIDSSTRPPKRQRGESYLVDETFQMEMDRREKEQKGHSQYAKVNAVEHQEPLQSAPEGELQNNIKQHPDLDSQLNDGAAPNESREPDLNTEARTEYDNAKREQNLELQKRLGLAPKMGSAPEPKPP